MAALDEATQSAARSNLGTRDQPQMRLCVQICRDKRGSWSVHGLPTRDADDLPSFSASIDFARRECAAAPATIELMVDGFYAVIHQERGWPRRLVAPDPKWWARDRRGR